MKFTRSLLVAAGLALAAAPAYAGDPYTLTLKGVNGHSDNGVYDGAYYGKLTSNGSTVMDNFSMFCIDYTHDVSIGSSWGVTMGSLTDQNTVNGAKNYIGYGSATVLDFKKAAWLASKFSMNPGDIGGIHGAIWNIFLPANGQNDLNWAGIQNWIDQANLAASNNFYGMDFSNWFILTPTGSYGQVQIGMTSTPEPATMLLMGSGLVGIFFVTAYKRRVS